MDLNDLKEALDDETILVSVMYVNNEIGAVEPIEEIGHIVKSYNPDIVFHVDAVSYTHLDVYKRQIQCFCKLQVCACHKLDI